MGPDLPAVDTEVARSELQGVGRLLEVGKAANALVLDQGGQLRVLLAVGQRIEPQQRGLLRRIQVAEADTDAARAARTAANLDGAGDGSEALGLARIGVARVSPNRT